MCGKYEIYKFDGSHVLAFPISFPLCCRVSMQKNWQLFIMNGFPFASSSFHKLVELQIHRIYLEHFPTQLPLSLDMIFISGTKRIVNFFRKMSKNPTTQRQKKPRWNSNLFHTNGPSWTYYIVACGHKAIVVMWTQSHCGVHAKHGV